MPLSWRLQRQGDAPWGNQGISRRDGERDNRYIIKFLLIFQVIEKCPVPSFLGQGDSMIHAMVGLSTLPLGKHITGNAHLNPDFLKIGLPYKMDSFTKSLYDTLVSILLLL